ncbi:heparinase II/III domain-containing protein [Algoriphagus sp. PAP.12]|uniref:heparinase II/III domain-containing protein n=1 Tax=Algoriphagus sp. PAP.12 TaxID=2996678 RepID=UPI00227AB3D5|nr:heparinase II/III family protein [Algoriphagus sp. PAP.12]
MKMKLSLFFIILFAFTTFQTQAQETEIPHLDNPMSMAYLQKNLRKSSPRLVFDKPILKDLKKNMKSDPVLQNMYAVIQESAETIYEQPLLERIMEGRRLLSVSREMLYRINMLGFVYLMEKDPEVLARINEEVIAVCNFSDWNPSHFLDVAEMALAVSFALDWTAGDLPQSTQELAKKALIEKALLPSWPEYGENPWWAYGTNNWNQVCNGGMIAASIAIAEDEPELASKTISRALDGLPHSLVEYGPDGVYPEGSTYWAYGTSFSVTTAAMLESAFGSDFGHWEFPAFKESAIFRTLANAPSGWYYNFADCGDKRSAAGDITLAWFASKSGNPQFFEKERFLLPAEETGKLFRLAGAAMAWISQYEEKGGEGVPTAWKGEGSNPVVFFTGGENDPRGYYFGGKGGRGMVNHGNMDAGSFIFELDGVRWSIDPGNQSYNELEQTGFDLWGRCQSCERWTLLTKNNYGHSTLTVNDSLHRTEGQSELLSFKEGEKPEAIFDLSKTLEGQVKSASRKFIKDSPASITIEDEITLSESTKLITWQMMTTAEVEITDGGAILRQDGKTLYLENISHPELVVSVVSLDPAPLELDRQIKGLKRIEIRIPAWTIEGDQTKIKVRLVGE